MLIERLIELRGRLKDLPPPYHVLKPIPWIIELDREGNFVGWVSTSTGPKDKGMADVVPNSRRTSGVLAHPLSDKADYVLGLKLEKNKPPRPTPKNLEAFTDAVRALRAAVEEGEAPAIDAVLAFLTGEQLQRAVEARDPKLTSADWIAFRVDGNLLPHRFDSAQRFWIKRSSEEKGDEASRVMPCAVCGEERPALATHPVSIRLDGEDAALISANKKAFESWGLERSEICPVCASCALQYGEALQRVLSDKKHRYRIGGVTYGYWTSADAEGFDPLSLLDAPDEAEVRALLSAPLRPDGASAALEDEAFHERFYALGATSNKRLVVRDWITATIPEIKEHLRRWFERQQLRAASGEQAGQLAEPHGVYALASSLVLDMNRLPPRVIPALVRAALLGAPVPFDLLAMALRRMHADADNRMTITRARIIRLALNDHLQRQEQAPVNPELNPDDHRPAYLCGRLFAVLENVQYAALGSTNATIADRFFGTASSAPASVFGRLMRGAQAHLQKLRKNRGGAHTNLQRQIEEIAARLPAFPRTLSLADQGLFALGYYHQRAEDARLRAERKATRGGASNHDGAEDDADATPAQGSLV